MKKRKIIPIVHKEEIKEKKSDVPERNIIMPPRRTKEEYDQMFGTLRKKVEKWTDEEKMDYNIHNAMNMFRNFGYKPWMQPFIDESGKPKIIISKKRRLIL